MKRRSNKKSDEVITGSKGNTYEGRRDLQKRGERKRDRRREVKEEMKQE